MTTRLRITLATLTALGLGLVCGVGARAQGPSFDYGLKPRLVAPDVYVVEGSTEDFSPKNGGNVVNTAFIITNESVVVIDAGPSRRYGVQLAKAIKAATSRPVSHILITHGHPDHYLGAQAFEEVASYSLPATITGLRASGGAYLDNMYRLLLDWMKGSEPSVPQHAINTDTIEVGKRRLQLFRLTGHTSGDLAIFDERSGVLFAGDLVFYGRTPTTPHASIRDWLASLDALEKIPFKTLVPGHGSPHEGNVGIMQTRAYLLWLDGFLRAAANRGADMSELLTTEPPKEFATMTVFRDEFARTLAHLYPRYERAVLK